MIVALILGLLNLFVRPLLILLTIPATILTLGLFLFVVNAIILGLAASLVQGFSIDGFLPAIVGALVLGFAQSILQRIFEAR